MTSCASRPAQSVYSISWPQSVSRAPEWCGAAAAGRRIAFGMPQIVWSQGLVRSCSGRGQRLGLRPRRLRQQLSASEGSDHEQHNDHHQSSHRPGSSTRSGACPRVRRRRSVSRHVQVVAGGYVAGYVEAARSPGSSPQRATATRDAVRHQLVKAPARRAPSPNSRRHMNSQWAHVGDQRLVIVWLP